MLIFLSIIGFVAVIGFGVYSIGVIGQNKVLKAQNAKLLQQNEELRDILLDSPSVLSNVPSHLAGKKIIHG